jgi:hypothetical protein
MPALRPKNYNLAYIDISDFVERIYSNILNLDIGIKNLPKKDLRKLTLHYFISNLYRVTKKKKYIEKPVYFLNMESFKSINNEPYIKSLIYTIKKLKSLLPIPIIVLNNFDKLVVSGGDFKGLCEKMENFYTKRQFNTKSLKKYLETEDFYELISIFKDVVNIKTLLT